MELRNVLHPTTFNAAGYLLQVVTYFPVTDKQAALIATVYFRQHRWLKKDLDKKFQVLWTGDRAALAALEAASAAATDTLRELLGPAGGFRRR